ncbi:tumor susceptibility gene 101 protein-like isoform X2 [Lethenteron reissneri]|nr:tumor susceptibility gene 101 protein-like isoform X2 [Lethenteron reissneri]
MAQGSEDALRPLLRNYRFRDLTLMEVRLAGARYAELHPGRDVYVATNGIDKNLLHLSGTIPVIYEGFEYNMPVRLWLPESFPYSPPLAFVQPTQDMILNPGHHVDSRGRVYLPYLQHWTHPNSTTCGLLQAMADVFAKEPPVSALPRGPTSPPSYNSWQ